MDKMELVIHNTPSGDIAELAKEMSIISTPYEILDLIAEAGMKGCDHIIIHEASLTTDFFDLRTKLAGEILQKFSNYRMKLSVIGDFSDIRSKSLSDFIRESNRMGTIRFVSSLAEVFGKLP